VSGAQKPILAKLDEKRANGLISVSIKSLCDKLN